MVQSASQFLPNMHSAGPAMGATGAWDLGYQGEGMSVAILDTGLSYENPSFIQEPQDQSRVAYTKEDIATILEANNLHAEALSEETSLDTVYYSGKVPFGFNYADGLANFGTDDDTGLGHGTHVAGIVAGNLPEEVRQQLHMETLGIAPEAQLVIMKVFDMDGMCYFDYLIAAMEDAIALGVDCANLSLGSACGPHYYEGMTEVYDAARAAGINVVVAAGNDASTGYRSLWGEGLVESSSVSTGTLGMPGTFDSVLTVASMENPQEVSFEAIRGLSTVSWYNRAQGFRQFFAYQEAESVPEGMGFQERLAGQFLTYATRWEDAEGKLMFAPFEGGNADGIMAQAVQSKAAAVILYSPTVAEELPAGMAVHFSLTRFDVPMVRHQQTAI
ncbi:MAG: S8 family serine peptidase [Oscillospiraceae bacterium]